MWWYRDPSVEEKDAVGSQPRVFLDGGLSVPELDALVWMRIPGPGPARDGRWSRTLGLAGFAASYHQKDPNSLLFSEYQVGLPARAELGNTIWPDTSYIRVSPNESKEWQCFSLDEE